MSPNIFGRYLLGTSAIQLCNKTQEMHRANFDDTNPHTPALNTQLLPSQNGRLPSLISHNSQGKMMVWFGCCGKKIEIRSGVIFLHHCCMVTDIFEFLTSHCVTGEKERMRQLSGSTTNINNLFRA